MISLGSCCPSVSIVKECVNPASSAAAKPVRSAAAFPRFRACVNTVRLARGLAARHPSMTAAVESVQPSLTTMIGTPQTAAPDNTSASVAALLYVGIMMTGAKLSAS